MIKSLLKPKLKQKNLENFKQEFNKNLQYYSTINKNESPKVSTFDVH